jgi:S1-C subfamily serine protease
MTSGPDQPPLAPPAVSGRLRRVGGRVRRSTPFVGGILAAFVGIWLYGILNPGPRPISQGDINDTIAQVLASQTPGPPLSELAYAAIRPSLVVIQTDATDAKGAATEGLGSGVVVNASGQVLTALHVVANASAIHLTFADGSTSDATIASSQADIDIAVLLPAQVPTTVAPATLGNPGALQIGDDAFVVGNPFGLTGSMSAGVVSGLNRSFQDPASAQVFHGLIQVDAAVNPGNSGGPLLDRSGRVVGIVTALVNPTKAGVFVGIGLAVPINVAGGGAGLPLD